MVYVPMSVIQQLDRLKQMDSTRNVWDVFQEHAQVGLELETSFGWLFKKRRL
jgi:hypothetical protein